MKLLLFYVKEVLKTPMLYLLLLVSGLVFFLQGNWIINQIPTNQEKYETRLGFQNYRQFKEEEKQQFITERTNGKVVPAYVDNMTYKNRIKLTLLISNDELEESEMKAFLVSLNDSGEIKKLKFFTAKDLSSLSRKEFEEYRQSLYLPYGYGYSFFTQTYSTRDYNYSINLPYPEIVQMFDQKQEKISAPIARYLVRILTIFLSIGVALMMAWLIYRDVASQRFKSFRIANTRYFFQIIARIVSLSFSVFILALIMTTVLFIFISHKLLIDYSMMDYIVYFSLSVGVSLLVASVVAAIVTAASKNLIVGFFLSFLYVIANATTSDMSESYPFGLKWYKFIPGVTDMLWDHQIFPVYIEHQVFYLMVALILFSFLLILWRQVIQRGKVLK